MAIHTDAKVEFSVWGGASHEVTNRYYQLSLAGISFQYRDNPSTLNRAAESVNVHFVRRLNEADWPKVANVGVEAG